VGKEILSAGARVGLHGLCYFDAGARSFYTRQQPVNQPSDLRGQKIRVQQSRTAMDMIQALGGAPTPIPFGDLYTALQQGVVDGAENNPPTFLTSRHYEVCKYFSLDEHALVPDALLMSETVWRDLPSEAQGWLSEAAVEAAAFQRKLWAEKTADAIAELEKAGVEVSRPPKQPFAEAVVPMLKSQADPVVGRLVERILAP
jgi:tripartite ATP-independent transporter DctP family solute receptor